MISAEAKRGLTAAEAEERLRRFGPNEVAEERPHPWLDVLGKFWAPVPWMLEAAVILELTLGRQVEAAIIGGLLVFNAVISFAQEDRAQAALDLLRQRLSVRARALRGGHWQLVPARELVPGDVIHVRVGDFTPADATIIDGQIMADVSMLTGESLPAALGVGAAARAGSVVTRGEATAEVTATGARTYFGRTAELVRTAKTAGHLSGVILGIVRYLVAIDVCLVAALLVYAAVAGIAMSEILPFALVLLIASVPVALPATFTVATALGALEMSHGGVIVTRLSAIEEAAGMDVLCADKTGTITQNRLALGSVRPAPGRDAGEVLRAAALASDEATQDPIDLAIIAAARGRGLLSDVPRRVQFVPFDPSTKRSEARFDEPGASRRIVKGAPAAVFGLADAPAAEAASDAETLAADGARVLAVACGDDSRLRVAGIIALEDPLRADSRATVDHLRSLGVRVVMITGDGPSTARSVADAVGIGTRLGDVGLLRSDPAAAAVAADVFAGVLPEDKYHLVQGLQRSGHIVGMTGDGVNDAPALKQAEVGIAVSSATDVAKAAASLVLTVPGLSEAVAAVDVSRRIYQRMLTYTLNKVIKTVQVAVFLSLGLILTGDFVTTPRLVILLLFANDFMTMSIATDRVSPARRPDRWPVRALVLSALALAAPLVLFSFGVLFAATTWAGLDLARVQTAVFLMLIFTGQATVYLVRERGHFWHSRPGRWLLLSSAISVLVMSLLAERGWLMAPLDVQWIAAIFGATLLYLFLFDGYKTHVFRRFGIAPAWRPSAA
ncbi:MAG: plasma-membrane proton-efflux P-type ATPase [Chloroflexota bacterium]|nr:plasma-membrane proton-efflux P-type ATPase [Chloroflexota bacterium]